MREDTRLRYSQQTVGLAESQPESLKLRNAAFCPEPVSKTPSIELSLLEDSLSLLTSSTRSSNDDDADSQTGEPRQSSCATRAIQSKGLLTAMAERRGQGKSKRKRWKVRKSTVIRRVQRGHLGII